MPNPNLSYVICTAPRTGSSLLCASLWQTGIAGRPAEYFDSHAHIDAHWQKQLAIGADAAYFGKVLDAATTANGVFGFKLHWHQTSALMAKLLAEREGQALPDAATEAGAAAAVDQLLRARLGDVHYIWLRRKNRVAQAISYFRASKTDVWRVPAAAAATQQNDPQFDFDAIEHLMRDVEKFDRGWYDFFVRQRLRALILVYEDFIAFNEKTVRGVLGYLGLGDPQITIPAPQYRRQADERSAEWERRFRERLAAKQGTIHYTPRRTDRPGRAAHDRKRPPPSAAGALPLIAYDLGSGIDLAVEPAPPTRPWMDATDKRFAYRCLPLVIANQAGWLIRSAHRVTATWDGSQGAGGIRVLHDDTCKTPYASSHFGAGILTFSIGRLFRTPPGYNLHVRGPANWPKDGIAPLDAIVETDWNPATFTMNWKFTRPGHTVTFEAGEPIAMISPLQRGDIERFRPELQPIGADPEWEAGHMEWSQLRASFNTALKSRDPAAVAAGWQRHYLLGVTVGNTQAPDHQTALSLAPFADLRRGDR